MFDRYTKKKMLFWAWNRFERLAAAAAAASPTFRKPEFPPSALVNSTARTVQRRIFSQSPKGYISVRCHIVATPVS